VALDADVLARTERTWRTRSRLPTEAIGLTMVGIVCPIIEPPDLSRLAAVAGSRVQHAYRQIWRTRRDRADSCALVRVAAPSERRALACY
jgi:hypothetical protein